MLVYFLCREHGKVLLNMIYQCVAFDVSDQDIVTSGGTLAFSLDSLSKQRTLLWGRSRKFSLKRK